MSNSIGGTSYHCLSVRLTVFVFFLLVHLSLFVSFLLVHLVDIWNMIESFRENGLNSLELQAEVNIARLHSLLNSIYLQLNKRVPVNTQIDEELHCTLLMYWLLSIYDR